METCSPDALEETKSGKNPESFDPLKGTWLLELLDPLSDGLRDAPLPWFRVTVFVLGLLLPLIVCSAYPSPLTGGQLFGKGSFAADIGTIGVWFFLILAAALLPVGRRRLPGLLNELVECGVVDSGILNFNPRTTTLRPGLRVLEWLSRVDGFRGMVWFAFMFLDQIGVYSFVLLGDGTPRWIKTDAIPGSIFYSLAVEGAQPNLAGLWAFVVVGPVILYVMMVIARLLVVFACLCSSIAANKSLKIVPCHPDGMGGLGPIGGTALFLSLFTFALGIDLAALTINELVINRVFLAASAPATSNLTILTILWVLYLGIGTLLFFMPLMPFHQYMAKAKSNYLSDALRVYMQALRDHHVDLEAGRFRSEILQGAVALDRLIRNAVRMAVWPLDTKTAVRYGGLLVSPLAPVAASQFESLIAWFKAYTGLA